MIFLMYLIYFSIPALLIFAVQYLFCQCRHIAVKLIPTVAALGFLIWCAATQSQLPEEPRGCPTGAGITAFLVGGIFISFFVGISLGWGIYLHKAEKNKNEDKIEGTE